jgi:N-acyl-D-amino-acid deacylase
VRFASKESYSEIDKSSAEASKEVRIDRRQLLGVCVTVGASLLFSACETDADNEDLQDPTPPRDIDPTPPDPEPTPTPQPEPTPTPTVQMTPVAESLDLLIQGGTIVDGSGEPLFDADVGVRGDRIVAIGDLAGRTAGESIDASGKFVAPGFINTHSHVEEWIWEGKPLIPSLMQGVTTEIAGLDGESALDVGQHLDEVEAANIEVNYGSMIGHAVVRRAVLGEGPTQPGQEQLDEMRALVEQGMVDGAFGFSTGLEYAPGFHAQPEEIQALAEIAAGYDAVYNTHMRDEGQHILDAIDEAVDVGRQTGITVVITHLKVRRLPGWPDDSQVLLDLSQAAVDAIHEARVAGIDVWADTYPYTSTWGNIERSLQEMAGLYPPEIMTVSHAAEDTWLDRSIPELAHEWGISIQAAVNRVLEASPDALVALQGGHPDGVRLVLTQEFTMVAVDNPLGTGRWAHPGGDVLHPRTFGTYPRLLGRYVREEGLLEWEDAIHRSTGLPATLYAIPERGFIREGYIADLVVFDPERIVDRATYAHPERYPDGISHVLVNGVLAVADGVLVRENGDHRTPGRVLRRG